MFSVTVLLKLTLLSGTANNKRTDKLGFQLTVITQPLYVVLIYLSK